MGTRGTRLFIGALGALVALSGAPVAGPGRLTATARAEAQPTDGTPLCGVAEPSDASEVTPAPDDGALRVASLNLLHSETDDGDLSLGARLPLLAESIVSSNADIVGAQEVTRNLTFDASDEYPQKHGLVAERLAAAVADLTGEAWSWCWSQSNPHVPGTPDLDAGGGNPLDHQAAANGNIPEPGDFAEGLAVFTRFTIDESRFRRLPPRSYETAGCLEPDPFCPLNAMFDSRQVLWARVATPDAEHVDMFTTHIAHHITSLSDTTKLVQSQAAAGITEEWATDDALPDFLVGDFNSTPDSAVHAEVTGHGFVDSYAAAGGEECAGGLAGCSGGPSSGEEVWSATALRPMSERIDYVFVRPATGCRLTVPASARIADVAQPLNDGRFLWPSDHYGFVSQTAISDCG